MKKSILFCSLIFTVMFILAGFSGYTNASDWELIQFPGSEDSEKEPVYLDTGYLMSDITTDIHDNLYIMNDSRIMRFTPDGQIDTTWGKNGIIYDEEIQTNSEQMHIVADSRGYVYAECRICVDGSPSYIKRYSPNGEVDMAWYGDGVMGGKVSDEYLETDEAEADGVWYQSDIAIDSNDNLYVLVDRKVYRFAPDGQRDKNWQILKIKQPEEVYEEVWFSNLLRVDHQDKIYLFNGFDATMQRYTNDGEPESKIKCGLYDTYDSEEGSTQYYISNVSFDVAGNLYTMDLNSDNSISRYTLDAELDKAWCSDGTLSFNSEGISVVNDLETDTKGNLYILNAEMGVVCKYSNDGKPELSWGSNGKLGNVNSSGEAPLKIDDITSDNAGGIYISTFLSAGNGQRFFKFSNEFKPVIQWGDGGRIDTEMHWASMAAYKGLLFIEDNTDVQNDKVTCFDRDGKADHEWKTSISPNPVYDIHTDKDGMIYIADADDAIYRFSPSGEIDSSWGSHGRISISADPPSFLTEMVTDADGCLYVSERQHNHVLRYTPEGKPDTDWGDSGKINISTAADSAGYDTFFIAVDDAGNLYVTDYVNNKILRYDCKGMLDTTWCDKGEWKSEDTFSENLMPMVFPMHIMITEGKLYAIWNGSLYRMSDEKAQLGLKPGTSTDRTAVTENLAIENPVSEKQSPDLLWIYLVSGAALLGIGAVLTVCIVRKKKKKV